MVGTATAFGRFVGRARELGIVDGVLARAGSGDGAVVLVTGESGIGKTRFGHEVAARARAYDLAVVWGTCWPDGAPPLWPWQSLLADLGETGIGSLFEDTGTPEVDPERFLRFVAVTEHLAAAARRSPALIVLDDLQAADAGAVLLTRFVARAVARLPVVLLLLVRTGAGAGSPLRRIWDVEQEAVLVSLGRFNQAETADFVRAYHASVSDGALLRAVHQLTDGHPLHLHRLVGLGTCDIDNALPNGVRAAIAEAVDRLPSGVRGLLRSAAVLGGPVDVREAAAMEQSTVAEVSAAVAEAASAGLAWADGPDRFSISHELVRETLLTQLTPAERARLHARAADVIAAAPGTPDRLAARARHAVAAATISADRARTAISACRTAAQALSSRFGYEAAADLLADAVAVHERARLADRPTPVLVEWAEAVLRCGRLAEAREVFARAAVEAERDDDPVMLARAAIGLGGVWLNEHRTQVDWERVTGWQRRALRSLPAGEVRLRHRLRVRLASEDVYRGGEVAPVLAALDEARRLGDGLVLAESLSLAHHALLTAERTADRLPLAEELIAVASTTGEGLLALVGLCWRTVDLFHLGDARAVRSLAELRERADALRCGSVLFIAEAMDVMLLIRAGRLDDAEKAAGACFRLGSEVGDADALGFLGAHLVTIRWLQGRDEDMLGMLAEIADSPTLNPAEFGFRATLASVTARAGDTATARDLLDRLTAAGLSTLPQSSTWLAGMLAIAEAARLLADAELSAQVYELLTPYADLPVMPSLAVTCFGSVQRVLGITAATAGHADRAVDHLERAVRANRLLGNQPFTAIATADLADALAYRARPGDLDRAVDLYTAARSQADRMGMTMWSEQWGRRQHEVAQRDAIIERARRHWTIIMGGRRAVVADRIGVGYLAQLLTSPGRAITALELVGGPAAGALATPGGQPVLDARARAAYRQRVAELTDRLEAAEAAGDGPAARRLHEERDAIFEHLRQLVGRGGRLRGFPDQGERARTAVRKAIRRAIDEIAAEDETIGDHLAATVTTGASCSYQPGPGRRVRWRLVDVR